MNTSAVSIPPRFQLSRCVEAKGTRKVERRNDCHFPSTNFAHVLIYETIFPPFLLNSSKPFFFFPICTCESPTLLSKPLIVKKRENMYPRIKETSLSIIAIRFRGWLVSTGRQLSVAPYLHSGLTQTVNKRALMRGPCRLITPAHYPHVVPRPVYYLVNNRLLGFRVNRDKVWIVVSTMRHGST